MLRRLATPLLVALVLGPVLTAADVSVTKTASSLLVERGDPLQWTITVSNAAPGVADNVVLTDILQPQLTFDSITAPPSYSCTTPAPGTNGTITCTRLSSMPAGTSDVFTLNTTVSPTAAPGAFPNDATATTTSEATGANNTGHGISAVIPPFPDVSITKSAGAGPFFAGDRITFTITVNNAGPGSAHNVEVTDTIPAGATLLSAAPTQGTCSGAVCNLGTIAAGGSASITIVVRSPGTPGPVTNTASVTLSETDPDPANNTDDATVTTTLPPAPAGIPTLSPWMLFLFGVALVAVAVREQMR